MSWGALISKVRTHAEAKDIVERMRADSSLTEAERAGWGECLHMHLQYTLSPGVAELQGHRDSGGRARGIEIKFQDDLADS
jgi:hypothetical protein